MNHYSVHLILIASALNTYLVSGTLLSSHACQFQAISLPRSECSALTERATHLHTNISCGFYGVGHGRNGLTGATRVCAHAHRWHMLIEKAHSLFGI